MKFWWPDLHFGPINLWSAPWLGRKYVEWRENFEQQRAAVPSEPDARHIRMVELLNNHSGK